MPSKLLENKVGAEKAQVDPAVLTYSKSKEQFMIPICLKTKGFVVASLIIVVCSFANIALAQDDVQTPTVKRPSEDLRAAMAVGEIKVTLSPRLPTEELRGVRWSPKGTKVSLLNDNGVLKGELVIGDFAPRSLTLEIEKSLGGDAVFALDVDGDGKMSSSETTTISANLRRGKYWYSTKSLIELPFLAGKTRVYPFSVWYVHDPEEPNSEPVIRWSRNGWHEGTFELNGITCRALVTDANGDGVFSDADSWGLGASDGKAYEAGSRLGKHNWLNGISFDVVDFDRNGRFVTIRAFDLGMTEEEDRRRQDPYAEDRSFPRAASAVQFIKEHDVALKKAKEEEKRVLVDFVTTWCGPCRVMDQLVYTSQPIAEKSSDIVFLKLDGDEQKELKEKYEVEAYPTLILLDQDGEVLRKAVGYQSVKKLLEFLK